MAASLRITKAGASPQSYAEQLAELTDKFRQSKEALELAEAWHREAQDQILSLMSAHGTKSGTAKMPDANYKVTMVAGERLDIDEVGLRKALSAQVFDALCQRKLDRTKLELAIAEGRIDPVAVAAHTVHKVNKPYVKVSMIPGSEK